VNRHRWRRSLLVAGLGIGATVVAVVLITQATRNLALVSRLRDATPGWLVVCAVGEVAAYTGFVLSYQAMARVADGPRLPTMVVIRVVGVSFGAFSLATAIGGLSVDFWALHEAGEPTRVASARVIALETLRWAVLSVATCVAGIVVLVGIGHNTGWVAPVAWLAVTFACFAAGLWVSAPRRRAALANRPGRLGGLFGIAVTALVFIRRLRAGPRDLRRRAVGGSALFWAGELLCAWAALRSFGVRVDVAPLVLGYATGYLATGLPLPLGGAGSVDAALTGGFVLAGAPLGSALLAALAFRLFSFWLPAIGALVAVATARGLPERLREIARARRPPELSAEAMEPRA
jgi:uncharacterized membrane protein YbhN (UPF0104 family)